MAPTPEVLIKKAEDILRDQDPNFEKKELTAEEALNEFILPGLKNSKDILSSIYDFKSRERAGFLGQLKSKLQNKIINTIINTIEKPAMKQQKFNELTFKAIEALVEENNKLRKRTK